MKINQGFVLPYIIAIGIFDIICTAIALTIDYFIFNISITQDRIIESYLIGYIILFILNLKSIEDKEI